MKVSKDSNSSLNSIENLSEILPSSSWAQVRYQQPKMAKNLPYLWHHSQKTWNPKQNFCFTAESKTCQVFEGLNSSLVQSA